MLVHTNDVTRRQAYILSIYLNQRSVVNISHHCIPSYILLYYYRLFHKIGYEYMYPKTSKFDCGQLEETFFFMKSFPDDDGNK